MALKVQTALQRGIMGKHPSNPVCVRVCVCVCVCVMTLDGWVVLKPFPTHDTPTGRGPALVTRRPHRVKEERNELKGIWMPAFGVTVHAFPSGAGGVNKWTPRSF